MPFPNLEGKHAHDSFFTPKELIDYRRSRGSLPEGPIPSCVILCYQNSLLEDIKSLEPTEPMAGFSKVHLLANTDNAIGVCGGFGIGAPAVSVWLEELIAVGVSTFVNMGTAGGLSPNLQIGDIVVCDKAVRDEGVSHHYLAASEYAHPSLSLTRALQENLTTAGKRFVTGPSWTIDAVYRETVEEARHYQRAGVLTVEMEAAAVFAIAEYRKVDIASAFVISDSLAELVWNPQFGADAVKHGLYDLYQAARATALKACASG